MNPPKQGSFARLAEKHEQSALVANLPLRGTCVRYFPIYGTIMKSVRLTEDAFPTIFNKLGNAKPKRISSLMKKLNRKRCMSDNRIILGENYWNLTVHACIK